MYYDESKAYAELCERLYGKNLLQMGMGTFDELDILLEHVSIAASDKVLDLGCCFGRVTEYLCSKTGADFTGIDLTEKDVCIAKQLERDNLHFMVADMAALPFADESFDKIISLDSLYFVDDLEQTLDGILRKLKHNGTLVIFWSQPPRIEMRELSPELSEIGRWASSRKLSFQAIDRIQEHILFWQKSKRLFEEMESAFIAEGMEEDWNNHMKEQKQVEMLATAGRFPRWLFFINNH